MNAYIARYCLSAGVPRLWLEDAVQDCEVAMWRRGLDKRSIWSLAYDAARKYGPRGRTGTRPQFVPLDDYPYERSIDDRLDVERNLARLTAVQRGGFLRWWFGRPMTARQRMASVSARNRLRRLA